ncbi:hypothetical protein [Nonomuraea harbinensis]|uniref:Uncharacterized protein n=1 Tax=Nonomuraea harbinensis TaxID=1286938 RepID=A0ABW1BPG0_9ACTN|nr:hypothetical protein [Nonomuraea harbinensis]
MMSPEELERENEAVLDAVQALLGLISPDVIAVAVRAEKDRIELSFWVRRRTSELDEDIEDAIFDMEALHSGEGPLIEPIIHDGAPDPAMLGPYVRMIYWAKH